VSGGVEDVPYRRAERSRVMDPQQFDRLVQTLTAGVSRRRALRGLGALAIGGTAFATRDEASAITCDICQKKRHGRCKPKRVGAKCGEGGSCCEPGLCCDKELVCDGETCSTCPETETCDLHPVCGYFSSRSDDSCLCITSVEGTTTCSSLFAACFACDVDQDCTDEFGVPSVCMDLSGCTKSCGGTGRKACFVEGCERPAAEATAASRGGRAAGDLRRMTELLPGP
jgi:hypothetical protein